MLLDSPLSISEGSPPRVSPGGRRKPSTRSLAIMSRQKSICDSGKIINAGRQSEELFLKNVIKNIAFPLFTKLRGVQPLIGTVFPGKGIIVPAVIVGSVAIGFLVFFIGVCIIQSGLRTITDARVIVPVIGVS